MNSGSAYNRLATSKTEMVSVEKSRLSGRNLLLPNGSKYDTQEEENSIKAKRISQILNELKHSIETGEPLTYEADNILRKVLTRERSENERSVSS